MIRETAGDGERGARIQLAALERLPQPLHMLEYVADSQHYHFGCFVQPEEGLESAQDRMSTLCAGYFARGATVLDIGCGLGGTSRLLEQHGLHVIALDPCVEVLAYARERARMRGTKGNTRFLARTLQDLARAPGFAANGALALEVLQHFPELREFFGCCRSLLAPGALLVLHDVATTFQAEWPRVPFHPRGRVRSAAAASGFAVLEQRDLSREILPTLPRLAQELATHRAELVAAFDGRPGHLDTGQELELLLAHMRALQSAFERGELVYETTVLVARPSRRSFPGA